METVRGASNNRHERNRVRGTVIVISTVVTYLFTTSFMLWPIYVIRSRVMQMSIRKKVRATPPTLVGDAQVED